MNADAFASEYAANGFALQPSLLTAACVEGLRQQVSDALAQASPCDERFDFEPVSDGGTPVVQRVKKPHEHIDAVSQLARDPAILDYVEKLIGPDIRLHHSKINVKAPVVGSPLEWHQDWAFVPHSNQSLVFVSVFIDDVPIEKGPLLVLPQSHKQGLRTHHDDGIFYGAIDPASLSLDSAVPLTGSRGTVSFHHPLTVHGSGLNKSTEPRRVLFLEYAAADAWPFTYGVEWESFHRRLVRGRECITPRLEAVEVRMPYPAPSGGQARIYSQQRLFTKRHFVQ